MDVGDKRQVGKRKTKAQLERERQLEELKQMMDKPGSRYFLWRLLSYCNMYSSVSSPVTNEMLLRSGMRDVGLWLLSEIMQSDASAYRLMQAEAIDREGNKNG